MCLTDESLPPIRAAIRMIEEDPDTMLDVLHLLDHGALSRSRSRQMPTRTGTDRLQLSGAVVLADGCFTFTNLAYKEALAAHFTTDYVGHVLRIAGRWAEAIEYLAPRLRPQQPPADEGERAAQPSTFNLQPATAPSAARPQLLEAIVQSIYATDSPDRAYELLADGLRLGFGLSGVAIYCAVPARGQLQRVFPPVAVASTDTAPPTVDLHDPACVEAQTYHLGNYALRGTADEARLIVALQAGGRPIGVVTVERYIQNRDPHLLPDELPDLLRYLQHAAGAMDNALIRAAYRTIGQAVLDAKALQPTVEKVLETVADALGADYAVLYLVDETERWLEMAAGIGRVVNAEWQSLARFPLSGRHPAVTALQERRMMTVRAGEEAQDRALVDRFSLHKFARAYLPLHAAGEELGTLELGYASGRARFSDEYKRTLAAFSDQTAIAVHNSLLLRRTDEALTRKIVEISVGRDIQLSLLPKTTPVAEGWDFAAAYQAARTVGGDFYDFVDLPGAPPRLGIVIADVADKGVPAALFMAVSRTIIRSVALTGRGPAATLMRANQLILSDSQADLFLSAVYAVIELQTGRVIYANAGHNLPLWYHAADGRLTELSQHGIVLGTFEDIKLVEGRVDLASGDALVFYTDGVTDALNAEGEMFGDERFQRVVAAAATGTAQEILWAITGALAGFIEETEQADDVTCVVVKRE
jgi:sigma-B regulation protein RsbU (phosphoserine phosphatase)